MKLEDAKYIEILDYIIKGKSYREIAGTLDISKNTVTDLIKRLRSTGTIFPSNTKKSFYDPIIKEIQENIIELLRMKRRTCNSRRKTLTNQEIYLLLLKKGYNISFTKVKELIRFGKNIIKESYLNIHHLPGESVEFDWGTMNLQIGAENKTTRVCFAIFSFPYSNFKKVYVLPDSSGLSFVIAFKKFIIDVNGVPPLFKFDNMRIARKLKSECDSEVILTPLFRDLSTHYQFKVEFCSPYCPNQKGNVENSVGVLKKHFEKSYITSFHTINEVQQYVDQITHQLNERYHPRKNDRCNNLILHEQNFFRPIPRKDFVYFNQKECRVSNQGMITFRKSQYAVPEMFRGEKVIVRYNAKGIYILEKNSETVIAKYSTATTGGKRKYRIWYILHKLRKKANGFLDSQEYQSMSKTEKLIFVKVFKNNCMEFFTFCGKIKNRPRDLIKKFVHKNKDSLDNITVEQLINILLV